MAQYISLEDIVKEYIISTGENSQNKTMRYMQFALQGLRDLNLDVAQEVRSYKTKVPTNGQILFPSDAVDMIKISIKVDDKLLSLGRDRRQFFGTPTSPSDSSAGSDSIVYQFYTINGDVNTLYGLGGGNNTYGYYRVDRESKAIQFSAEAIGKEVHIEYISDGRNIDGDYEVHSALADALTSYMYWKSIQRKRNVPATEKQLAKMDWYNEKRLARARMMKFNMDEALQVTRKGFKQAPKL